MERLNTMESFVKGFNIIRNGEIITLTAEEMRDFKYLEKVIIGRDCLENYKYWADDEDKDIIDKMMNDENVCFNIEDDILDSIFEDVIMITQEVIEDYIKKNRE